MKPEKIRTTNESDRNRKIEKPVEKKVCLVDGKIVSQKDFFKIWNEKGEQFALWEAS